SGDSYIIHSLKNALVHGRARSGARGRSGPRQRQLARQRQIWRRGPVCHTAPPMGIAAGRRRLLLRRLRAAGLASQRSSVLVGAKALHSHAAVLGPRGAVARFIDRLLFAEPDGVNPIDGNVVLRHQVLHHGVGPPAAQEFVVGPGAGAVGVALYRDKEPFIRFHVAGELVEILFAVRGEREFVKFEGHRHAGLQLVVVDIGNNGFQAVYTLGSLLSHLVGLVQGVAGVLIGRRGVLIGRRGMLVGRRGLFLGRVDAALGFLVDLFHLVASLFNLLAVM